MSHLHLHLTRGCLRGLLSGAGRNLQYCVQAIAVTSAERCSLHVCPIMCTTAAGHNSSMQLPLQQRGSASQSLMPLCSWTPQGVMQSKTVYLTPTCTDVFTFNPCLNPNATVRADGRVSMRTPCGALCGAPAALPWGRGVGSVNASLSLSTGSTKVCLSLSRGLFHVCRMCMLSRTLARHA